MRAAIASPGTLQGIQAETLQANVIISQRVERRMGTRKKKLLQRALASCTTLCLFVFVARYDEKISLPGAVWCM